VTVSFLSLGYFNFLLNVFKINKLWLILDVTPTVVEFDQEIVGGCLAEYLKVAQKLGGEIAEHAVLVQKAFT